MAGASSGRRVVAITGVTRGLGLAMAREFARRGHTVAGCGRSGEAIARLSGELGSSHLWRAVDVSNPVAVDDWARDVIQTLGPPDLLVNNAAIINRNAPLWAVPPEEFASLLSVNLLGIANTVRSFVPAMIERGTGVVVNFSSYWGRSVARDVAPYCATKWGVEGLTQALARDLPRGLAAVAFNPGIIDTEMLRSTFGEAAGQYADPADWAGTTVPFLLGLGPRDNGKQATAPGQ